MLYINSSRCSSPFICDMFLETNKLKDDSSNDADLVRDLRFILIAAQMNYVLDAPLGERPATGADVDVMNVWQARSDDYSIVQCAMLYSCSMTFKTSLKSRF